MLMFIIVEGVITIWTYYSSMGRLCLIDMFKTTLGCWSYLFTLYLSYFASIGFITLVSYERFIAVCHPLRSYKLRTKKRSGLLVALTWT